MYADRVLWCSLAQTNVTWRVLEKPFLSGGGRGTEAGARYVDQISKLHRICAPPFPTLAKET